MTLIGSLERPLEGALLGAQRVAMKTTRAGSALVDETKAVRAPLILALLILGLLLPTEMSLKVAGLRLTPYRLVLIAGLGPE